MVCLLVYTLINYHLTFRKSILIIANRTDSNSFKGNRYTILVFIWINLRSINEYQSLFWKKKRSLESVCAMNWHFWLTNTWILLLIEALLSLYNHFIKNHLMFFFLHFKMISEVDSSLDGSMFTLIYSIFCFMVNVAQLKSPFQALFIKSFHLL